MKHFIIFCIILFLATFVVQTKLSMSQPFCGIESFQGENDNPDNFRGGFYKPAASNIGGAPADQDFFPVLIVFVQFKNEPGDSTTTNFDCWPARKKPNYMDGLIRSTRSATSSSWWNSYNEYAISDYWHEFSRGKLHVIGRAEFIILSHEISYYNSLGIVNKEIYDTLKNRLGSNWRNYDQWTLLSDGEFAWQKDKKVDMIYTVFRLWRSYLFDTFRGGVASTGQISNAVNYEYTVYADATDTVNVYCVPNEIYSLPKYGSGVRVFADSTTIYSRQKFLDIATHEHGHYLFLFNHKNYGKMQRNGESNWEFSLDPWEVIKLGYIKPKFPNYSTPAHYLYDYSSRGQNGSDTNEIIQIPITSDSLEFFLIANRRKVSQWDRRIGGDTLAESIWQFLKNTNPEYGKGLYIYHIRNGYQFLAPAAGNNDIDLECADGLWNWVSAYTTRKRIDSLQFDTIFIKQEPSYNNDYPGDPGYSPGRDEISKSIIFTPGSPDDFYTNPIGRGTHSLFTNIENYWYSLASLGDRWDAWNVGYNEVFSPYSSPSTKAMNNDNTGIFIWYRALDNSNNKATIEIYRVNEGGKSEAQILQLTPPSRPMGLRVLSCDSLPLIDGFKRIKLRWNHNMEPDMGTLEQGSEHYSKKYKVYRSTAQLMTDVPPDAMFYPEQYYEHIETVFIDENSIPEFTDTTISYCVVPVPASCPPFCWTAYPVRYRVQAVDKYDSSSRLSDFAKTIAGMPDAGGMSDDNLAIQQNNIPKEYSLNQNYPNPFNPTTNIQYDLPFENFVTIKIYDVLGKEVMSLVNEFKNAGSYIISFNGSNLSSGIYFYKIEAGNYKSMKQMVLIK